jgi:hypothetical protein
MKKLFIFMFFAFATIFYLLIGKSIEERKEYVRTHENSLKTHFNEQEETKPINEAQKNYYERIYTMK